VVGKAGWLGLVTLAMCLALPVAAKSPRDQMFPAESWCYARSYSKAHLAEHPVQQVTDIALTPDRGTDSDPMLRLVLKLKLRGLDEVFEAVSYCENEGGDTLYCAVEGDGGGFAVTPAKGGAVLMTVSSYGVGIEGATGFVALERNRGDDRSFLMPMVEVCP
jgi:hypothetical protein